MKHVNVSVKVIVHVKKVIVVVLECEDSKYLKSIVDTSVIEFDGIITVMDIVSTKVANHIAINITSIASINFHYKKKEILHTVLLVILLLLIIIIICYYYAMKKGVNALKI